MVFDEDAFRLFDHHTTAQGVLQLARHYPDWNVLATRQRALGAVGRSVGELFAMAVVLARAADRPGDEYVQGLADVFCTAAGRRLADLRPDLQEAEGGDTGLIAERWLGSQASALAGASAWEMAWQGVAGEETAPHVA